jgi:hypothetical protein
VPNDAILVRAYPRLYHMAHAGAWPSIERFGLLSTTALLDLFEIGGERRQQLESSKRPKSEEINHPTHGRALLRDQIPLNESKLAKALQDGLTPRDWYRLLNRKSYFWGPESRLKILREAREYSAQRQTIVVIDTEQLVARHGERISLCHMNSGATQPMAFPRGLSTFLSIDRYPLADRLRRYGVKGAVAEVTVDYSVPDLREYVIEAYEVGGSEKKRDLLA